VSRSEVSHVVFDPMPLGLGFSPLERITNEWERGGWALLRVVPVHQREAVAVFTRSRREADQ
jgi:hypothetical protein